MLDSGLPPPLTSDERGDEQMTSAVAVRQTPWPRPGTGPGAFRKSDDRGQQLGFGLRDGRVGERPPCAGERLHRGIRELG
ncbi:hypothetical protein GCM10023152_13670 [Agromyces bauzanensis]|uniref:Uncharacterized protein n=1 Tax=Agromyces bauzanensis TaxID=1308924 RepID=A0A917PEP7_9MICO|nr:hypothetical protein GCM10011372_09280 [Agromyces bauzanensis]